MKLAAIAAKQAIDVLQLMWIGRRKWRAVDEVEVKAAVQVKVEPSRSAPHHLGKKEATVDFIIKKGEVDSDLISHVRERGANPNRRGRLIQSHGNDRPSG